MLELINHRIQRGGFGDGLKLRLEVFRCEALPVAMIAFEHVDVLRNALNRHLDMTAILARHDVGEHRRRREDEDEGERDKPKAVLDHLPGVHRMLLQFGARLIHDCSGFNYSESLRKWS